MAKIRKFPVSSGICWVEVPEVDLRILCGCPEDVVKHLMQRGLIQATETRGVVHETGPNAILLNDVMLQNGAFTNLAEFPVLQMLYRQGMILPGHPNNNGSKPLLIGSRAQIDAQMAYIYRGNYGLVSKDEIAATGADAQQTEDLFRMKLAFAFGALRKTEDLLDGIAVEGDAWVEIRASVEIRRTALSEFEFRYGEESVSVNLNLAKNQRYWSPYPLGFHDIQREYFSVIHSGQGDGWDVNRPSMGGILTYQGKVYLIDAGPNVLYSLMALGIGINEIEGIFHTHCHDDHFAGLTTLMRADHRIKHYSTPLVRASVFKKLAALMGSKDTDFGRYFDSVDLCFDEWSDIDGLEVKPRMSPHPVETSIFEFRTFWDGRYLTYSHLADITSLEVLERMVTDDTNQPGIHADLLESVKKFYFEKVDLKKIDVGGGMIHGKAEDFTYDMSERIILAHNAQPLTMNEKIIGSSAPFGTVDVLIPDYSDNQRQLALDHLVSYFPEVERSRFKKLLNNPIVTFQPGSIILREGHENQMVYLILTGIVEMLTRKEQRANILPSGGMIGEYSGLHGFPAETTYRSVSYVRALVLPAGSYLEFVRNNHLYTRIERQHENRQFLLSTWLFGEFVGPCLQNKLSREMKLKNHYTQEPRLLPQVCPNHLYLVKSGRVERMLDGKVIREIGPQSFFGEESVINDEADTLPFTYRTTEPTGIFDLDGDLLRPIPVVMWKLLESHKESMAMLSLTTF